MRIFKYLKKYWIQAILAPLSMVMEVLMDLFLPILMTIIVNIGILGADPKGATGLSALVLKIVGEPTQTMDIIIRVGIVMICATFIGGCFGVLSGVFTNIAAQNYGDDLRRDTFKHIMELSFEQTDQFTTGSLVTRITNDITQVQNMVSMSMRMVIRTLMQFIGGIFFLTMIGTDFGVILMIALPILLIIIILFLVKASPMFGRIQKRIDNVNSVVQENVTGARVVKAYVREDYEIKRFATVNNELYEENYRVFKLMALISPLMSLITSVAMISVMYIGGTKVIHDFNDAMPNGMIAGDVIASTTYITMIINGFMMLAMMFQSVVRGAASIKRLNQVLDSNPVIVDGKVAQPSEERIGTIEFKNVSFAYPNSSGENVLVDLNFKIEPGESIGILGSTGCGKSTLVHLIPRFYDVTSGEVWVDGRNVKEYPLDELRHKVAMVLQKSELYSGTIEENIAWGKENSTLEEIQEAAKIAQADDFISSFEDGYQTMVTEKGSSLSGGQKQRVSIARALLRKPKILIFDDSTSALDLATEAKLYEELSAKMDDTTKIIIAQRVASVKNADKIMILNEGKIVAFAPHDELIKTCPIYIDIYNSQLKKEGDEDGNSNK